MKIELTEKDISALLLGGIAKDGVEIVLAKEEGTLKSFLSESEETQTIEVMGEMAGTPNEISSKRPDLLGKRIKKHWASIWNSGYKAEEKENVVLEDSK